MDFQKRRYDFLDCCLFIRNWSVNMKGMEILLIKGIISFYWGKVRGSLLVEGAKSSLIGIAYMDVRVRIC